jgi:preprotein translocase subunit SecE
MLEQHRPQHPTASDDRRPFDDDQVEPVTTAPATNSRRRGGSLGLFVRQVVAELKKVVRPTRNELLTYTTVVLVFVCAVMAIVSALDYGFGKLVLWVFSGSS